MKQTTDHAMLKGLIKFLREVEEFENVYIAGILIEHGYAEKDDLIKLGFDDEDIEFAIKGIF